MTDPQQQIEMDVRPGVARAAAGWHPEHIKAAIRARGMTLTELGDRCGVASTTLSRAIKRPMSKRLEQAIARFLGIPAAELWPSRYPLSKRAPRRGKPGLRVVKGGAK